MDVSRTLMIFSQAVSGTSNCNMCVIAIVAGFKYRFNKI